MLVTKLQSRLKFHINKSVGNKRMTRKLTFIDFKGAFDSINYNKMLEVMERRGMDG